MKVYIIQNIYGSGKVTKVFDSEEKAKEFCDKENEGLKVAMYHFIEKEVE